jgi:nitrate/nitrite transporter NarK
MMAAKGAALIDVLLIVGILFAVVLADRVGRIRLQVAGFIGCAVGLALAALSLHVGGALSGVLIFAGFMLFNFMTNAGPNAMTYLIAGEVFPTSLRRLPRSAPCSRPSFFRSCSRTLAPTCCC